MTDDFKEEVRQHSDIVEVVNAYVPLKRAGNNFTARCPFHNEKTPSFSVNPDKQFFYCFGCQKGGDVFRFIMEHEGVDFPDALRLLAGRAGLSMPERGPGRTSRPKPGESKADLYELHEKLAAWYQNNLRAEIGRHALQYVRQRGIDDDLLVRFRIGYAPDSWDAARNWGAGHGFEPAAMLKGGILTTREPEAPPARAYDRFRNRLMFPIGNEQGRIIAFSGRILDATAHGGKYVNSPETSIFQKSNVLYAMHLARPGIRERGWALICEGQLDVIACHEAGFTNAVAPQGTAFTEAQARLLKRYTENIVLAFDADQAGINAALKSLDAFLPAELVAKVALMAEGEDPDSLVRGAGPDALRRKLDEAVDFFVFMLDLEIQRGDATTPAGKARIATTVLEAVARLRSPVARSEYCELVAARLQVRQNPIFQQLRTVRRQQRRQAARSNAGQRPELPVPAPAPGPVEDDVVSKAEGVLLDMALHHQNYATRLLSDLPVEFITATPVGHALNEVLAHTAQGEWEAAGALIQESVGATASTLVSKAIVAPDFGADAAQKQLEKAYTDCVRQIREHRIEGRIQQLRLEMRETPSRNERQALQKHILELSQERAALRRRH